MKPKILRLALAGFCALFFLPLAAFAQRELMTPTGGRGELLIEQLAGFRASSIGGFNYATPIGFSIQRFSEADFGGRGDTVLHQTTFWLAPSADYFVIDRLSLGGIVEIANTSSSVDVPITPATSQNFSLPSTTNLTILPRVGYMIPLGDRFGIWPRGGIGYISRQTVSGANANAGRETFSTVAVDADVSFLFRINETFFLSAAPEFTLSLGGSHSVTSNNGATLSADGNFFQFAVVGGIGVLLDLL